MKKFLVIVGILCCLFFSLSSCGSGDTTSEGDMEEAAGTVDDASEDAQPFMDEAEEAVDDAAEAADEVEENTVE